MDSEMHCIFDIVEHHPIAPLIATVVELNSPYVAHGLEARKEDFMQRNDESFKT